MKTAPNSLRMIAPVGHASMQPAFVQCLQTSLLISHRSCKPPSSTDICSTKATCRQVVPESSLVLSYESPVNWKPSEGNSFHCLHATSHALHPMHKVVSVKKPVAIISFRLPGAGRHLALRLPIGPRVARTTSVRSPARVRLSCPRDTPDGVPVECCTSTSWIRESRRWDRVRSE